MIDISRPYDQPQGGGRRLAAEAAGMFVAATVTELRTEETTLIGSLVNAESPAASSPASDLLERADRLLQRDLVGSCTLNLS